MNEQGTEFTIGTEVDCSDGACGALSCVVVDPVARAVTHIVVEPRHRSGLGRLVPLNLVGATGDRDKVVLGCTRAAFDRLEVAEETRFLTGGGEQWGYEPGRMLAWPYYGLAGGAMGGLGGFGGNAVQPVTYESCRWGRWRCAGAIGCTPPMVTSAGFRDWSSTLVITM